MSRDIEVRLIYREERTETKENNWLESMDSIKTSFCKIFTRNAI